MSAILLISSAPQRAPLGMYNPCFTEDARLRRRSVSGLANAVGEHICKKRFIFALYLWRWVLVTAVYIMVHSYYKTGRSILSCKNNCCSLVYKKPEVVETYWADDEDKYIHQDTLVFLDLFYRADFFFSMWQEPGSFPRHILLRSKKMLNSI